MCRLLAYLGPPTLVADVVLWPDRSIIKQSYDARERLKDPTLPFHLGHGNLNGDGFGIGWYSDEAQREKDPTPCVFTSITPAWNNENLARLALKIISPLMFAHVRAAYPGIPVSEQNCHPFMAGRYLFMHNGAVGGFQKIKRALLEVMSDDAYNSVSSFHSDSAVSFALFLHHLPDMTSQLPPETLLKAMQDTISCISSVQRKLGITSPSLLNFTVSDGTCLVATRYVYPGDARAASLYYAEGASFQRACHREGPAQPGCDGNTKAGGPAMDTAMTYEGSYELKYGERGARCAFVASEPITASSSDWVAVPRNSCLAVVREKDGFINIMRAPLCGAADPSPQLLACQREVALCLEAVARGISAKSRELWQSLRPGSLSSADHSRGLDEWSVQSSPVMVNPPPESVLVAGAAAMAMMTLCVIGLVGHSDGALASIATIIVMLLLMNLSGLHYGVALVLNILARAADNHNLIMLAVNAAGQAGYAASQAARGIATSLTTNPFFQATPSASPHNTPALTQRTPTPATAQQRSPSPQETPLSLEGWGHSSADGTRHDPMAQPTLLARYLGAHNIDICGLQEVRHHGSGCHTLENGYHFIWSGGTAHTNGVGALLSPDTATLLRASNAGFAAINDRILVLRFHPNGAIPMTAIVAYAPTEAADNGPAKDAFYEQLHDALTHTPAHHYILVMGDFNATTTAASSTTHPSPPPPSSCTDDQT
ncbi:hypothetical protein FOA52_011855 [Chlamydomonas sp. UWO 241]|nr:hypothetical protein FOA52_011855 [Chlamydomonas sp. UWO 241]